MMRFARTSGAMTLAAAAALALGFTTAQAQQPRGERQVEAAPRAALAPELKATSEQAQLRAGGFIKIDGVDGESRRAGGFIKIDGVDGESRRAGKDDQIDVLSWSWGVTRADAGGAGGGGRIALSSVDQVTITRQIDKSTPKLAEARADKSTPKLAEARADRSSPKLAEAVSPGQKLGTVVLEARPRGGAPGDYVRYTLHDAIVSSVRTSGSGSDEVPTESISLSFSKVEVDYRSRSLGGMLGEPPRHGEASRRQE